MSEFQQLIGPELPPISGKAESLVVFAHGWRADGDDMMGLAVQWAPSMPDTYFMAPNAPMPSEEMFGSFQWYDLGPENRHRRGEAVREAANTLNDFLDQQLAWLGLPPEKLVMVGFSQGYGVTFDAALRRVVAPAALVGFTGSIANKKTLPGEILSKPPVMMIHGDADPVIPVKALLESIHYLRDLDFDVTWHISHGLGHEIDQPAVDAGRKFVEEILYPDAIQGQSVSLPSETS